MVTTLEWLSRSLRDLADLVSELEDRGVGFRNPKELPDTMTAGKANLPRL